MAKGNPFSKNGLRDQTLIEATNKVEGEDIYSTVISDSKSHAEASSVSASVEFGGWGVTASASASSESSSSFQSDRVTFLAIRRLKTGYKGWTSIKPDFSAYAKKTL